MSRRSVNRCYLLGTVGKEVELRTTRSGKSVCSFNVVTNDGMKGENANWHKITVWEKQAESCKEYLKKGSEVFIEGEIAYRSYEDKNGNKVYATEIVARNVTFVGGKSKSAAETSYEDNFVDDDPPF